MIAHVFLFVAVFHPPHDYRLILLLQLTDELLHHHHRHQHRAQPLQISQPESHVQQPAVGVHELEGEHLHKINSANRMTAVAQEEAQNATRKGKTSRRAMADSPCPSPELAAPCAAEFYFFPDTCNVQGLFCTVFFRLFMD